MINNAKSFLLFLLTILAVNSCRVPNNPFNRPEITPTIMGNCAGFRDGQEIDATNFIGVDPLEYNQLEEYYDDIEYRLYICKRYGSRRCR